MGYDMRWLGEPDGTAERRAAAHAVFSEAVARRDMLDRDQGTTIWPGMKGGDLPAEWTARVERKDGDVIVGTPEFVAAQSAVSDAYEATNTADVSYFRANIRGMDWLRGVMVKLGMMHYEGHHPDWAQAKDFGLDYEPDSARQVGDSWVDHRERPDLFSDAELAYFKADDEVRAFAPEVPGIPAWKFGSNDGWIVGPVEIGGALHNLAQHDQDEIAKLCHEDDWDGLDFFTRWVEWMRASMEYGGFEVH